MAASTEFNLKKIFVQEAQFGLEVRESLFKERICFGEPDYSTIRSSLDGILEKWIESEVSKNKKMKPEKEF